MRSCAYCGKDLAPGEKCNCRMSNTGTSTSDSNVNSNNSSNTSTDYNTGNTNTEYSGWQESTYRTGYTKKEKKKFKNIFKRKKYTDNTSFKSAANGVSGFTKRFIKDPVSTVSNPGNLNVLQIIIIILTTSISLSLCGFFCISRLIPSNTIFHITYGITDLLKYTLSGTLTTGLLLLLYLLTSYIIGRFLMKSNASFGTFLSRPVSAMLPLMTFSILGFLISFFTIYATVMLVMVGFIMWIVLTYEAMRTEWSYASPNKVMYAIAITFFVFFTIIFNFVRVL